jgi:hypothetical protein
MTAIKHCAGCKHWSPPGLRPEDREGTCWQIRSGDLTPDDEPVPWIDDSAEPCVVLRTPPDFGCTLHEGVGT